MKRARASSRAKRLTVTLIILAAALAAAVAALMLTEERERNMPYNGSRFVMSSTVYLDIPARDDAACLRDGSEPYEGGVRSLESEVRYKGFTEADRLMRNAEGGI